MEDHAIARQRLTMRVGRGSLSFSTIGQRADGTAEVTYEPFTVKSGISMAANLREAFKTAPLLAASYQRVSVMVDSPVLMIPVELFSEGDMETLYDHSFPRGENRVVLPCVLPTLNAVAAFAVNKDLKLVVDDHCPNATFCSVTAPVWRHLHHRSFTGARRKLYAYFHDKRIEVFAFSQNRFKFYNSFDTSLPHDAIYYLLYVWKKIGLNAEDDELHVVGEITDSGLLTDELHRYLQRVYVINPAGDFNRAPVTQIKGMPYDLMTYYVKGR